MYASTTAVYIAWAFYSINSIGLGLELIFLLVGYFGLYHKLRKNHDNRLMIFLPLYCFFSLMTSALSHTQIGIPSNANIDCTILRVTMSFVPVARWFFYLFLTRKAELVKYSGNASRLSFRVLYVFATLYMVWFSLMLDTSLFSSDTPVYFPNFPARFCLMEYKSWTVGVLVVLEVIASLSALYLFVKPLRAHVKEMKSVTTPRVHDLSDLLKRNFKASVCAICVSFVALFVVGASANAQDYGLALIGYGMRQFDSMFGVMVLIVLSFKSWEFPPSFQHCLKDDRSKITEISDPKTNNNSGGTSNGQEYSPITEGKGTSRNETQTV